MSAKNVLSWLKSEFQVVILSDTFYQFSKPLMKQLAFPTLFCHNLIINKDGFIVDYILRQKDQKTKAVKALQSLNLKVISAGDSYNDIGMIKQADAGILFCPPKKVIEEFPQFPVATNYDEFQQLFSETRNRLLANA